MAEAPNAREALQRATHDLPGGLLALVGRQVTASVVGGVRYAGWLYTVDPELCHVVLLEEVRCEGTTKPRPVFIMGHSLRDIVVHEDVDPAACPFDVLEDNLAVVLGGGSSGGLSAEQVEARRTSVKALLEKNQLAVCDGDNGALTLSPWELDELNASHPDTWVVSNAPQQVLWWARQQEAWTQTDGAEIVLRESFLPDAPLHVVPDNIKYWLQRHSLFSLFDNGISLDQESWYSVTPEEIAARQALRCQCDTVVDAFCGSGGNSIQLAFTCTHVISIDMDPVKIASARHNAKIYGVADRIDFLVGDFASLAAGLKADVVFASPPWGGPEYRNSDTFDVETMLPIAGARLMELCRGISSNVALFLPRNCDCDQLRSLAEDLDCDIEYEFVGQHGKGITAYYGALASPDEWEPA